MVLQKTIEKLFKTSLIMFIVLSIATIPVLNHSNVIRTNLEIEDITNLPKNYIYLLNKNNYLVRTSIFINQNSKKELVLEIIKALFINNHNIPKGFNGYISKETKILNCMIDRNIVYLDFSKELLTNDKENNKKIITGIVYSILELDFAEKVSITIQGNKMEDFPEILDKKIGINQKYEINSRNDINKIVIYYLDENSYLPVTKYLNDKRDKIEIIIEELKNPTENFKSPIDNDLELLNYKEEENVLFLNFNEFLNNKNKIVKEETLDMIALSAFDNYDVNMVMFEIEGKEMEYRKK